MKTIKLFVPLILFCQILLAQGVKFEDTLTWTEVKRKAKSEQKIIFLDFTASWCAPCKKMESETYSKDEVANVMNSDFISVKVQQDTIGLNMSYLKSWKRDSEELFKKYDIKSFPTLLFVTPNGTVLHKRSGYMDASTFINFAKEAKDPSKQYVLLNIVEDLIGKAIFLKETEFAKTIAKTYINSYLMKKPLEDIYSKTNLDFLSRYVTSADEEGFKIFYPDATKAELIAGDVHIQKKVIDRIISEEIINPFLFKDLSQNEPKTLAPDWNEISLLIEKKFGKRFVKDNIFNAKVGWYYYSPWKNYYEVAKAFVGYYGLDGEGLSDPNQVSWDLFFTHINDKKLLKIAAGWMKKSLKADSRPEDIDTYANLLYKIGDNENAIKWETKAVEREAEIGRARKNGFVRPEFSETLEKMKAGIKTWSETKIN